MKIIDQWNENTKEYLKSLNGLYIYGAGYWGRLITKFCVLNDISVSAIVVYDTNNNINEIYRIPVETHADISERNTPIIVAVDKNLGDEVTDMLIAEGWLNIIRATEEPKGYEGYNYNLTLSKEWYEEEDKLQFWINTRQILDFDDPKTFNEKIQWIKLRGYTKDMTRLADKYLVREWIKEKIGEEYLIPLLGVWDSFDEIDFDNLPNEFALKCNHGSGYNYIVTDKEKIDKDELREKFNKWMNENFAYYSLEMQYEQISPKIIAEKVIYQSKGSSLVDYKFHCFNGKPEFVQIIEDRDLINHTATQAMYDMDGEILSWCFDDYELVPHTQDNDSLQSMARLARKLSERFKYVRVDFYDTEEGIKFGEMTFTPGNGMYKYITNYTEGIDYQIGKKITL